VWPASVVDEGPARIDAQHMVQRGQYVLRADRAILGVLSLLAGRADHQAGTPRQAVAAAVVFVAVDSQHGKLLKE
jgi:hypothetical protein